MVEKGNRREKKGKQMEPKKGKQMEPKKEGMREGLKRESEKKGKSFPFFSQKLPFAFFWFSLFGEGKARAQMFKMKRNLSHKNLHVTSIFKTK